MRAERHVIRQTRTPPEHGGRGLVNASAIASVAASDSAKPHVISLDGDGPAAPADPLPRIYRASRLVSFVAQHNPQLLGGDGPEEPRGTDDIAG